MTCIVDAVEERDVAVTDIKGAYLNARMHDVVIMKITGPEIGLFCELDKSLSKFVTKEKGKSVRAIRQGTIWMCEKCFALVRAIFMHS